MDEPQVTLPKHRPASESWWLEWPAREGFTARAEQEVSRMSAGKGASAYYPDVLDSLAQKSARRRLAA